MTRIYTTIDSQAPPDRAWAARPADDGSVFDGESAVVERSDVDDPARRQIAECKEGRSISWTTRGLKMHAEAEAWALVSKIVSAGGSR